MSYMLPAAVVIPSESEPQARAAYVDGVDLKTAIESWYDY